MKIFAFFDTFDISISRYLEKSDSYLKVFFVTLRFERFRTSSLSFQLDELIICLSGIRRKHDKNLMRASWS